jgi:hypothetical protein
MIEMYTVDARWLKFVRPLDARHFSFMRPTLKFHAAMDSAFSLFWIQLHKILASGTPGRTLTESLLGNTVALRHY